MYSSEYLRNKQRAAPQIICPPQGVPSSLRTQIVRFANSSVNAPTKEKIGHVSVCCATTITEPTEIPADPVCCDLIAPTQFPRGFYGPVRPDCPPVNNPPLVNPAKGANCCN